MTKTTKEEKIRIILRYVNGQEGLNQIAGRKMFTKQNLIRGFAYTNIMD